MNIDILQMNMVYREQLVKYYRELVEDYSNNIWKKAKKVRELTTAMFQLSVSIIELYEKVKSSQTGELELKNNEKIANCKEECKKHLVDLSKSLRISLE